MADADMRWMQRLENYEQALATLKRAHFLAAFRPLRELEQLGLIQTFEFTHELSWLILKDLLIYKGMSGISGSRDAVRQAVVRELLPAGTESTWMAMIRSRNLTSHTYNPAIAEEIKQLIFTQYGKELQNLQQELRKRAEQIR
ncbi:nucleotidyltransferase substrate binding protein [Synechococcus sp. AH-707-B22]|nr:nucleotidyltransferase substrate binding protein [Synechococcus sp. AH-707-B22]